MGKIENMLLGITIGDSFGSGYESFQNNQGRNKEDLDFTKYKLSGYLNKKGDNLGMYSDDAQMSIAISEAILNKNNISKENLIQSFLDCYKRDPIQGYSNGLRRVLKESKSVEEFLETVKPYYSKSSFNGAAMRSVPIGILPKKEDVIYLAIKNAEITHNNPKGIASSVSIALLSHYNLYEGNISRFSDEGIDLIKKIDIETANHLEKIHEKIRKKEKIENGFLFGKKHEKIGSPRNGLFTTGIVYYLLNKYLSPKEILKKSILMGGDTDTIGAITLGINLTNNKIEDLPPFLYQNLRNHKFGKDYIIKLGKNLEKKFLI